MSIDQLPIQDIFLGMTSSSPPDIPGYSLVMVLSESSNTRVDLVLEQATGSERVIKYVRCDQRAADPVESLQLLVEPGHPHLVAVYALGMLDGWTYLVMEYLPGQRLEHLRFEWNLSEILVQFGPLASALEMAASHAYFGANPCPENLAFVDSESRLVLLGFNPCPQLPPADKFLPHELIYWSPERLAAAPQDERSYVYSLGMLLYVVLIEHVPEVHSLVDLHQWHTANLPPTLPTHLTAFQPLLDRSLILAPEERFKDCFAFAEALAQLPSTAVENAVAGAERVLLTTSSEPLFSAQGRLFGHQLPINLHLEAITAQSNDELPLESAGLVIERLDESALVPAGAQKRWVGPFAGLLAASLSGLGLYLALEGGSYTYSSVEQDATVSAQSSVAQQQEAQPAYTSDALGLMEEAQQLAPLAPYDSEALRQLVVIYRAALRGEDARERRFAEEGMALLQEQLAEQLLDYSASDDQEAIQQLRDQITVLFDKQEQLPELAEALAITEVTDQPEAP